MLSALNSFIDFFWKARDYSDFESILIARLAVISSLFGLFIPVIMYLRIPLFPQRYYFIIAMIWLVCFIGLALIKFTSIAIKQIILLINIIVNFGIFCNIYSHGSNFSSSSSWLMSPVLISFFILGKRVGVIFFVINWLCLSAIQYLFLGSFKMIPKHWDKLSWQSNYLNDQMLSFIFNSAIVFIFVWIMDHTNRWTQKLLEENQEKEKALLEQSRMAELGEVSGNIAHEVNNPLAVISGNAQILRKQIAKGGELNYDRVSQSVDKILITTQRISRIVKGLKSYSRDATNDPFENFFVAPLIMEVQEMVVEKCMSHKVQLLPAHVRADISLYSRSSQIFQILIILLNNAIDAIEEQDGAWLRIDVSQNQRTTTISVIDSGPGISPELEEKVFTAFFTTKSKGKGTGLGLSIAKKLMFSLNAEIYIDRNHENSCFNLVFPNS